MSDGWRVDSLYTGKWNHTCPDGTRTAHEFGDVCGTARHPSLPIEPPEHPYESGPDFICIHCGQIGSYAHTYPAPSSKQVAQPGASR